MRTTLTLNHSIIPIETLLTYDGTRMHWGVRYWTLHTYGVHEHSSRGDAERWNQAQAELWPAPDIV